MTRNNLITYLCPPTTNSANTTHEDYYFLHKQTNVTNRRSLNIKTKQSHEMIDNVYKQTPSTKNNSPTTLQHTNHSEKYSTKHNVSNHSKTKISSQTIKEIKQNDPKEHKDITTHRKTINSHKTTIHTTDTEPKLSNTSPEIETDY